MRSDWRPLRARIVKLMAEKVQLQNILMSIHAVSSDPEVKARIEAEFFGRTHEKWKATYRMKKAALESGRIIGRKHIRTNENPQNSPNGIGE